MALIMKEKLYPREWLAVITLLSFFLLLNLVAYIHREEIPDQLGEPHYIREQVINVTIQGEIENPGVYSLPRNSTLSVLLEKAQPTYYADLGKIKPESKLRKNQIVKIPRKKRVRQAQLKN